MCVWVGEITQEIGIYRQSWLVSNKCCSQLQNRVQSQKLLPHVGKKSSVMCGTIDGVHWRGEIRPTHTKSVHPQCTILDARRAARIDDTCGPQRTDTDEASPAPVDVVPNDKVDSTDKFTDKVDSSVTSVVRNFKIECKAKNCCHMLAKKAASCAERCPLTGWNKTYAHEKCPPTVHNPRCASRSQDWRHLWTTTHRHRWGLPSPGWCRS